MILAYRNFSFAETFCKTWVPANPLGTGVMAEARSRMGVQAILVTGYSELTGQIGTSFYR